MILASIVAGAVLLTGGAGSADVQGNTQQPPQLVTNLIQGFNIVLVLAETQPSGEKIEALPAGAKAALEDMREFLPYKHYRVLDSQWISCCMGTVTLSGRLQGVVGIPQGEGPVRIVHRPFVFSLRVLQAPQHLPVRFILGADDAGAATVRASAERGRERAREAADLKAEVATLQVQVQETRRRMEVGLAETSRVEMRRLEDRINSLRRRLADLDREAEEDAVGARPVIDSSFTMDAGETVVVGTSRLGGDKALIALVTAVKKTGAR